jgi:hypothetical protein
MLWLEALTKFNAFHLSDATNLVLLLLVPSLPLYESFKLPLAIFISNIFGIILLVMNKVSFVNYIILPHQTMKELCCKLLSDQLNYQYIKEWQC